VVAREGVEAERASVEAMAMPYVIATPIPPERLDPGFYPLGPWGEIHRVQLSADDPRWTLKLCLWNLGSGPAIVGNVRLVCDGKELLQALPRDIPNRSWRSFRYGHRRSRLACDAEDRLFADRVSALQRPVLPD